MKVHRLGLTILMCIMVISSACTNVNIDSEVINKAQEEQPDESIELRKETEHFEFYCVESDEKCLEDLAQAVEENYLRITTELKADLDFKVKVCIYRDIDTFHKAIGQPDAPSWVVGLTYGNGIQMVSPLNPGRSHDYQSLVQVVVHEFTHVLINNVVQSGTIVPIWLHDGVAMYEAKQTDQLYEVGKWVKRDEIPSIDSLEAFGPYKSMEDNRIYPFSYTLVEYIINEYGIEKLNKFIRSPSDYSSAFGVDKDEFEQAWKGYLKEKYGEKESQSNIENVIQDTTPKNETKASFSPTGKYLAEAYGTITTITAGGLYPYEGIRVSDVDTGEVLWKMEPGYYTVDFTWSPDGRYIGIYYEARIYGESIVFDTKDRKSISLPKLADITSYYSESVKPQENRPDPYFRITGWENAETVIVDFRWNKEDGEYFSDQYTFNVKTHTVSYK